MGSVKVVVLRTGGTNCDEETAFAFREQKADVELVHINRFIDGSKRLSEYQILAIPGGFSYGDYVSAGKIMANELKFKIFDQLKKFIDDGKLIIGICNGFQIMAKASLLPSPSNMNEPPKMTVWNNDVGNFQCRWVYLKRAKNTRCIFNEDMPEIVYLPVAHGEGKVIFESEELGNKIEQNGQVVFYYVDEEGNLAGFPHCPNGAWHNIAGICDETGRIFALMPHPERHLHPANNPHWTRTKAKTGGKLPKEGDGVSIFRNAVRFAKRNL